MTSFTRVSIQWGHDDPTMEQSLAGEKELPEEVFWRDLEEITSHARPVPRSATETGRVKDHKV